MLFRSEGVDFTSPVSKLAGSDILVDFERNIVHHLTWLARDCLTVINKILCAESLDRE